MKINFQSEITFNEPPFRSMLIRTPGAGCELLRVPRDEPAPLGAGSRGGRCLRVGHGTALFPHIPIQSEMWLKVLGY